MERNSLGRFEKGHKKSNYKIRNGIEFICPICQNKKYIKPSRVETTKTCSKRCDGLRRSKKYIGENSANWKGGISMNRGYKEMYFPNHPKAHKGKIPEHILVIEKKIGRFLRKGEVVSHKNLNKLDNRIENLRIISRKESNSIIWKDPYLRDRQIKLMLQGLLKRPTSYEKKISELCIENNLPFIYTGNGTFLIGHKNPDFINKEKKIAIEVYHPYFKERDFGSCENYEQERSEYFIKYGYKTIFIRGYELIAKNWKEKCLNKIRGDLE